MVAVAAVSSTKCTALAISPDLSGGRDVNFAGVSTRELFPPFVARVNRVLLGMDVLGAGDARPAVHVPRYLLFWGLFAAEQACLSTLIFYGFGMHTVPAALMGGLFMPPMVAMTAWVEKDLFLGGTVGLRKS